MLKLKENDSLAALKVRADGKPAPALRISALNKAGIYTVGELVEKSYLELIDIPVVSKHSIDLLVTTLKEYGLGLGSPYSQQVLKTEAEFKTTGMDIPHQYHASNDSPLFGITPSITLDNNENLAGHIVGPGKVFHFTNRMDQKKFADAASQVLHDGVKADAFAADDVPGAILTIKPERDVENRIVYSVYVGNNAATFIGQHAPDKVAGLNLQSGSIGR